MSMEYIRATYDVPAKRGGRVEYTGADGPQFGTIRGTYGHYLKIQLDGFKHALTFHPTWKLRYLAAAQTGLSDREVPRES